VYKISDLTVENRKQLAESIRIQLELERLSAVKKNNLVLIEEIDKKLSSLDEIYKLNEPE